MKVEIFFTEHCTYSATIEVPDTAPHDPQALVEWLEEYNDDGNLERWFEALEIQHPKWFQGVDCRIEVNERTLDPDVRILAENTGQ